MATPTRTPNSKEEQDDRYSPETLRNEEMGAGNLAEQAEAYANDPDNHDVKDAEESPEFRNNYTGKNSKGKVLSGNNVRAILKKRGPLGLIAAIGLGGGLFGGLLFSPGLMLVQMKEALFDRFNYQIASMDTRTNLILDKKIGNNMTSGVCSNLASIRCKFSTVSGAQAERLKAVGIEIDDGSQKFGNRVKPGTLRFNGKTIPASEFSARYSSDLEFRNAMRKAYNPRFAGFADNVWARVSAKIGVTKQRALPDGDAEAKARAVQEDVKSGRKLSVIDDGVRCTSDGCTSADGKTNLPPEDADAARSAKLAGAEALDQAAESADNVAARAVSGLGDGISTAAAPIANFIKVTGPADMACQAYTAVRSLGYAAKTVRALQLARYAMVFMNTADQIKAGTATQEDVAYLGGILTNVAYDAVSGAQRKAAMDSFGMQYALNGTVGPRTSYVSQFMAGGGLTGDLIVITDYINATLGGSPRVACQTLANGWVQLGSVAAGITLMLIPGANVAITAGNIVKGVSAVALSVSLALLPELLKGIVAGTITDGLVGEDAGDAITSGAGSMMSSLAQSGGNAPLSVDDAVAYTNLQSQVVAQYGADEAAILSPLDPTSRHTFVGSIVSGMLPYISSVQSGSLTGSLRSLSSAVTGSISSIVSPSASALSNEQLKAAYTSCSDHDYSEYLEIATDPFCNPVMGIPTQYINKDPLDVVNQLLAADMISETGIPQGEYDTFIENCIEREAPLGDSGQDLQGSDGKECKIDTDMKANFYLFYVDGRIDDGLEGYSEGGSVSSGTKQEIAQNIVDKNKVTYLGNVQPKIEDIASGEIDGNEEPCGININILEAIDKITDKHAIKISSINRQCDTSVPTGSSTASRHYAGNGSALDIAVIDGVITTGRDAKSLSVIEIVMPILSSAASEANSFAQIGQAQCGRGVALAASVRAINDFCHHLHIDLPAWSDTGLKYSKGF